jgi:hypothetical protein
MWNHQFDFLAQPLLTFVLEKQEKAVGLTHTRRIANGAVMRRVEEFIAANPGWDSPEAFHSHFLAPMNCYTDMEGIARIQTMYSLYLAQNDPSKYTAEEFSVRPAGNTSPTQKAIDWLLVQIAHLSKPGLEFGYNGISPLPSANPAFEELKRRYKKPYAQCLWCSLPFYAENPLISNDARRHLCHTPSCQASQNIRKHEQYTPNAHPGCCYGEWGKVKHRLNEAISTYKKKYTIEAVWQGHMTDFFMNKFVKELFEHNRRNAYGVLTESDYKQYRHDYELKQEMTQYMATLTLT